MLASDGTCQEGIADIDIAGNNSAVQVGSPSGSVLIGELDCPEAGTQDVNKSQAADMVADKA